MTIPSTPAAQVAAVIGNLAGVAALVCMWFRLPTGTLALAALSGMAFAYVGGVTSGPEFPAFVLAFAFGAGVWVVSVVFAPVSFGFVAAGALLVHVAGFCVVAALTGRIGSPR